MKKVTTSILNTENEDVCKITKEFSNETTVLELFSWANSERDLKESETGIEHKILSIRLHKGGDLF